MFSSPVTNNATTIRLGLLLLLLQFGLIFGCGNDRPPLAPVHGVVTLDGKALADANVVFMPQNGRHSAAVTDAEGRYELKYLPDVEGAILGPHIVRISRMDPDSLEEHVPLKYNAQTVLKATVGRESNEINFDLISP